MKQKKYVHRQIEKEILQRVREFPVIVVTGPRQTGKSTMLTRIFKDYKYVSLDNPMQRTLAKEDPVLFLETYNNKIIIDEIQYAPELLDYIKIIVDQDRTNGRYIVTGSQLFPLMEGVSQSLAGRAAVFELLGFSFEEMQLKQPLNLFEGIFKGSFPEICVHNVDVNTFYNSYVQTYLERDIRQVRVVHDLVLFQKFLELLTARVGNLLNYNEISKECGVSNTTIKQWVSLLESTRIVYLLKSFSMNISKRVVKSPKVFLSDTGLISFLLRYPNAELLEKSIFSGAIFENAVIMEIFKRKINTNQRWELYFYRDSNHKEVDIVLDFGYKKILCEIKKTKTPQKKHWDYLNRMCEELNAQEAFLITNSSEELRVSEKITVLPVEHIEKLFI